MTTKEMNDATLSNLVNYYNELAATAGEKPVKSFKDKSTAIARIGNMKVLIKIADGKAKREAAAKAKADAKAAKDKAKPKKAKKEKGDDPLGEEPKTRGAKPTYNHEPAERQTPPRPGTLRGRAFELLQVGTTAEDLEDLVVEFWKQKGANLDDIKIGKRLRALGFREEDGYIYLVGNVQGTGPAKTTKAAEKAAAKAEKEAAKAAKKAAAKAEKPAKGKKAKVTEEDVL
jgi:hypothetical protein